MTICFHLQHSYRQKILRLHWHNHIHIQHRLKQRYSPPKFGTQTLSVCFLLQKSSLFLFNNSRLLSFQINFSTFERRVDRLNLSLHYHYQTPGLRTYASMTLSYVKFLMLWPTVSSHFYVVAISSVIVLGSFTPLFWPRSRYFLSSSSYVDRIWPIQLPCYPFLKKAVKGIFTAH